MYTCRVGIGRKNNENILRYIYVNYSIQSRSNIPIRNISDDFQGNLSTLSKVRFKAERFLLSDNTN